MGRLSVRRLLFWMIFLLPLSAGADGFQVTVRDASDGRRVPAALFVQCPSRSMQVEAKSGLATLNLDRIEGKCRPRVSSAGYRELATTVSKDVGAELPMTLWLDSSVRRKLRPEGGDHISGYIYDASTGGPLVGVLVTLEYLGTGTGTDDRGRVDRGRQLRFPAL